MAKRRRSTWTRGTARPAPEPQPTRSEASATADVDFGDSRTVDPTWDPASLRGAAFEAIAEPAAPHGAQGWRRSMSPAGISAVVAVVGLLGVSFAYVSAIKADVAVIGTKVDSLQKLHDGATANLRDDIRRVETSFEARLTRLFDFMQGRRDAESQTKRR